MIMTFAVASPAYAISNGYAFVETSVLANCDVQEKMEDITSISKEIVFPHEIIVRESTSQKRK